MDNGTIVADDTPDALKARVSGDVVTLRVDGDLDRALVIARDALETRTATVDGDRLVLNVDRGDTAIPLLFRALDAAALTLVSVQVDRPTLDDVFLTLTGRSLREDAA
jgi:ABC-2 type transport system ATP-binding protein